MRSRLRQGVFVLLPHGFQRGRDAVCHPAIDEGSEAVVDLREGVRGGAGQEEGDGPLGVVGEFCHFGLHGLFGQGGQLRKLPGERLIVVPERGECHRFGLDLQRAAVQRDEDAGGEHQHRGGGEDGGGQGRAMPSG
jgi:hypothetical protein